MVNDVKKMLNIVYGTECDWSIDYAALSVLAQNLRTIKSSGEATKAKAWEMIVGFLDYDEVNITFEVEKVIFNEPATIVIWKDRTKTVVKCGEDDIFDKEKGIALCYMKHIFGDKGSFNEILKKWGK